MKEEDVEEYDFDSEGDLDFDEQYSDEDCYTDVDSDESYEDLGEEDIGSDGVSAKAFLGVSKTNSDASSYTAESEESWHGLEDDDPDNPATWESSDHSDWYADEDWEEEEEEYCEEWEEEECDDQECEYWSERDHFP